MITPQRPSGNPTWLVLLLVGCSPGDLDTPVDDFVPDNAWYVAAGATDGDGSAEFPFASLEQAEAASAPGETLFVMASEGVLGGGITLQEGQKLIGLFESDEEAPRLTNTTGAIVQLSTGNEVAGLEFVDIRGQGGIRGSGVDLSNTHIHDCAFTGSLGPQNAWSVWLIMDEGVHSNIRVTDCNFTEGINQGGVAIFQRGESWGSYQFDRNAFADLGDNAYWLLTEDAGSIQASIDDATVDNIGIGGGADSMLLQLKDHSEQTVAVKNYRYDNTLQVGSASSTALEVFIDGFADPPADGCSMTLSIEDSVFENSVTDAVQLVSYGLNSTLDAAVRRTTISAARPQQGGAITFVQGFMGRTGNVGTLLIEDSDIVDSDPDAMVLVNWEASSSLTVDLGGGALGSAGNNRIIGSQVSEAYIVNTNVIARSNWWGGTAPRLVLEGGSLDYEPMLAADPRPE